MDKGTCGVAGVGGCVIWDRVERSRKTPVEKKVEEERAEVARDRWIKVARKGLRRLAQQQSPACRMKLSGSLPFRGGASRKRAASSVCTRSVHATKNATIGTGWCCQDSLCRAAWKQVAAVLCATSSGLVKPRQEERAAVLCVEHLCW